MYQLGAGLETLSARTGQGQAHKNYTSWLLRLLLCHASSGFGHVEELDHRRVNPHSPSPPALGEDASETKAVQAELPLSHYAPCTNFYTSLLSLRLPTGNGAQIPTSKVLIRTK